MKYMLLIHQGDSPTPRQPDAWAKLSEKEQQAVYADYQAINKTPGVTPGLALADPETAATVRVQDGKTLTTDGPFVEIKEAVGGWLSSRPTISTRRSSWRPGFRRRVSAARSRCARSPSGRHARSGIPRRVGLRPRCAHRLPRRLRPRRGSRAGGVRGRRGAVAARGRAVQRARVADDHRAQPRRRPDPARSHARCEDPPAGGAGGSRGRDGCDDISGRAARAGLHVLPPVA